MSLIAFICEESPACGHRCFLPGPPWSLLHFPFSRDHRHDGGREQTSFSRSGQLLNTTPPSGAAAYLSLLELLLTNQQFSRLKP
eukprot:2665650-Rhodomonas_salina.1